MQTVYVIYDDWGEIYKVCFSKERVDIYLSLLPNPYSFTVDTMKLTEEQVKIYVTKLKQRNSKVLDVYLKNN